jgi:hypothetical protein
MSEGDRSGSPAAALRARLVDLASTSGGWPYYAGQPARIEPTCWALLALSHLATPRETAVVTAGRRFLRSLMQSSGLLVEPNTPGPNYAWNGLALLALNAKDDLDLADRLSSALLGVRGIQVDDPTGVVHQNNKLQAWPWTDGTFSWLEPTALCLLALKVRRVSAPAVAARVADAEAIIFDRVCDPAGWNYGNAHVMAQDLRPYVPTTALVLLAMQDKPDHAVVRRSLDWLAAHATAEPATMACATATIGLHMYGKQTDDVRRLLADQYARSHALDNAHLIALAAYALTLPEHRGEAVRVS